MKLFKAQVAPLLILAIPLALTGLLESGVFFFETIFLARLGTDALAAGALVSWLFSTFLAILFGILSSINILVAQKQGARDTEGIALVLRDGLWLAFLFFIPAVILFWNIPTLFLWLGQSSEVVLLAKPYLHALVFGLLPDLIMIAWLELMIGLGDTHLILMFSLLAVPLNVFFSFSLIFGYFGLPALGIAGAGWGITISYWISGAALTLYVMTSQPYKPYIHRLFTPTSTSYIKELLRLGLPMGLMYCIEVGFFFYLSLCMGSLSIPLLAANQIVMQYLNTIMAVIFSFSQAITVRMGYLLGAGDAPAAMRAACTGIGLSFTLMIIVSIAYLLVPEGLISIDLNPHQPNHRAIVRYATEFLAICALFQLFEATRMALFGALRALKDTRVTLITSIISFWAIACPLGYILATKAHLSGAGLWWGMVIGAASSVPLLCWRLQFKLKEFTSQ